MTFYETKFVNKSVAAKPESANKNVVSNSKLLNSSVPVIFVKKSLTAKPNCANKCLVSNLKCLKKNQLANKSGVVWR